MRCLTFLCGDFLFGDWYYLSSSWSSMAKFCRAILDMFSVTWFSMFSCCFDWYRVDTGNY